MINMQMTLRDVYGDSLSMFTQEEETSNAMADYAERMSNDEVIRFNQIARTIAERGRIPALFSARAILRQLPGASWEIDQLISLLDFILKERGVK